MRRLVLAAALGLAMCVARAQSDAGYTELFYPSGALRIQAYLYRPQGAGPFPAVIYNHGSRDHRERESVPFEYVGRMLTRAGYLVLVPERRGYGKSDGVIWWQEASSQAAVPARLQAETDDVLAALEYLRTVEDADLRRTAVMGWSFGGIVTMLAVSRTNAFRAAINQAGGALSWDGSAGIRGALIRAAERTRTPTLLLVAANDRTTASITTLADILAQRGVPHRAIIYDAFTPNRPALSPGHAIFSAQGAHLWEKDVVEFLNAHLAGT
jgi:dienelactone hydrolase